MNKFEQVSSDGHQMLLAGGAWGGSMSDSGGVRAEGCTVKSNTIMGNGHMGTLPPPRTE